MDKKVMANAFKRIVERDGNLLEFVPDELKDEKMCMYAIANDLKAFKFVPEDMRGSVLGESPREFITSHILWWKVLEDIPKELLSKEICSELIEKEVEFFPGVPEEFIDEEMCKSVLQRNGGYLKDVPEKLKTQEICNLAIKNSLMHTIEYVPEDKRTLELYTLMVKENSEYYGRYEDDEKVWLAERLMELLSVVPKEMQTAEMYEIIGAKYPFAENFLDITPKNLITQKLCMELIKKDGRVLAVVPEDMRTQELCLEAIRNKGNIKEVPENLRNGDMYIEYLNSIARSRTGRNSSRFSRFEIDKKNSKVEAFIEKIPESIKSEEFWTKLVEKNGYYLMYIPANIKNEKLYTKAIQSFPDCVVNIPKIDITQEMWIEAVKNGVGLKYVEEDYRTPELYLEILKNKEYYYKVFDIPEEKKNWDIYVYAAKYNKIKYDDIPEEITSNRKFWEAVIDKNASLLKHAPKDMITPDLCQKLIEDSPYNIENIPEEFVTLDMCKFVMQPKDNSKNIFSKYIFKCIPPQYIMEFVPNAPTGTFDGLKLEEFLECVPEEKRTDIFYIKLLSYGKEGKKYIPGKFLRRQEFWEKIVDNSRCEFELVPDKYKTQEMCIKAVKDDEYNFQYVPENMKNKEIYEAVVDGRAKYVHLNRIQNVLEDIPVKYITPEMYAKGIWGGYNIDEKAELDVMLKMYKFDKLHHFVPGVNVLKKYPSDQIEKFDKKIWWHLTKNELYNSSDDAKNALVEALLSFGAFEKDENQEERVGMIEHFATYLPKKRFKISLDNFWDSEKEIINNNFDIKKYNKYVVNTEKMLEEPDFLSLFESQEKADEELDYIIWDVLGGTELSETQMKNVLEEYGVDTNENAVIRYVLQKGYDKQIDENNVGILLKTDLQELKSNNPEEGYELEKRIRKIYYKADPSFMMTPTKLHRIFDGMDMKYKPDFYEFFKNNTTEILKNQKKQNEISKIQKQWDEIVNANLGQRITFDKCEKYLYEKRYKNVEFADIGKLASNCGYSQEQFERVQDIYREQLKRKESSIPQIEGKCKDSKYTYKVLRLDDPTAIFVGELTDCCQAIDDAGESCMIHSTTSPNGRVLIVQDESGKVLAQSWLWRNKNVICFDNIEAVQKDSNNKKVVSNEILKAVKKAAKAFVEEDKTRIKKYEQEEMSKLEEEKANMTNGEYEKKVTELRKTIKGQQLNKVTVGIGYTDIDISKLKHDDENKYPEESVDYIHDSRIQLVLYEDSSVEHEDSADDIKTVTALYSDNEKSKKVINLDTSEIEYIGTYIEDELDEYEEDIENEDGMIDFEEGYIDMGEIETVINHPQDRAKARQALENIKEYLRSREGMEI